MPFIQIVMPTALLLSFSILPKIFLANAPLLKSLSLLGLGVYWWGIIFNKPASASNKVGWFPRIDYGPKREGDFDDSAQLDKVWLYGLEVNGVPG